MSGGRFGHTTRDSATNKLGLAEKSKRVLRAALDYTQGRNEIRWRPRHTASLAPYVRT